MNAEIRNPLLSELRRATGPQHDQIESLLRLTEPMSASRYAEVVRGFREFLADWEPRIHQALPDRLRDWYEPRRRAAFAADDLAHLGPLPASSTAAPARAAVQALPLGSLPEVFGSLYVIEGSALGGQVITPMLQRHLGLAPGQGASYFHGFGERTGAMWREFRQVAVDEVGHEAAALRAACNSAQRTFEALISTFRPLGAH
jgi:heme oxygenase (biliverdin-IX-beta and delta-forming)